MSDVGEPERADDMHGSGGPARVGVARPLTDWRFAGQLRESQKRMLDAVAGLDTEPLHLVAPPGSGKTLIGLQLAMRRGSRALVLAPTSDNPEACNQARRETARQSGSRYPAIGSPHRVAVRFMD